MHERQYDIDYKVLFTSIASGNEQAFKLLFEVFREKVYAVAFKWTRSDYAAEEITQDVFISIWVSRQQLAKVDNPEAYLYTAVYNKVSFFLKKEANQVIILRQLAERSRPFSNETEEAIYAHDSQKFLESAISHLSPQRKMIYELNRKQGKTYDEIAKTLHISRNTVKTHLAKAVKFVQNYVKENAFLLVISALYSL